MIQIRRRRHHSVPALNTAALPDLIFTVLFFFMIVTHMRSETPPADIRVPQGEQLTDTPKKHAIYHLYVSRDGTLQLGSQPVSLQQLPARLEAERRNLSPEEREQATVVIKADRSTPMSVITKVKMSLRRAHAFRISYAATSSSSSSSSFSSSSSH